VNSTGIYKRTVGFISAPVIVITFMRRMGEPIPFLITEARRWERAFAKKSSRIWGLNKPTDPY